MLGLSTEEASQVISPITGLDLAAMPEERRRLFELLALNYVQLTPTGPYKFTIVESRPADGTGNGGDGGAVALTAASAPRRVGFRENMDIKFLRPHEVVVSVDTGDGGVQVVANGSEAKIADAMLRVLHHQGVLKDAGHDLRFNMRPGGTPGRGEFGGVVEAFLNPGAGRARRWSIASASRSRCGARASKADVGRPPTLAPRAPRLARPRWRPRSTSSSCEPAARWPPRSGRFLGPDDALPEPAARLVETTLEPPRGDLRVDEYRHLARSRCPGCAARGDAERAAALRVLTELRKRVAFADLGGKALSTVEYVTDGGRAADGSARGRRLPPARRGPAAGARRSPSRPRPTQPRPRPPAAGAASPSPRATICRRRPTPRATCSSSTSAASPSEAFGPTCASTLPRRGGAPRLAQPHRLRLPRRAALPRREPGRRRRRFAPRGVVLELYGREVGDFLGALLEGAEIWLYGQGQCHVGMKADSGYVFVLQDALNTCFYAAHGGTFDVWDTRLALRRRRPEQGDARRRRSRAAQGLRSIHFGSPNEYAFEYLMSGGENSLHVVMGLDKPDARGELQPHAPSRTSASSSCRAPPPGVCSSSTRSDRLDPAQYHGNVLEEIDRGGLA